MKVGLQLSKNTYNPVTYTRSTLQLDQIPGIGYCRNYAWEMVKLDNQYWETARKQVSELTKKDATMGEKSKLMLDWIHYCEVSIDDFNPTVFIGFQIKKTREQHFF